ncbi:MAG: hypothetical protein ACKVZH_17955 [Blastocatellia bacterium]
MKRTSLITGGTLVVCLVSLEIASRTIASRNVKPVAKSVNATSTAAPVAPRQQPTPEVKMFSLPVYVASGFPVVIANPVVLSPKVANEKQDRAASARFTIANHDTNKINSVNLVLMEFQGAARLRRVDSWIKDVSLNAGASTEITVELERRVLPGDKLVLAVERVNGSATTRDSNFLALARAVADSVSGNNPPPLAIQSSTPPLPDDSGAALCSNGFRRAMTLVQAGDRSSMTSFTCDQADRSFVFTFSGKSLSN